MRSPDWGNSWTISGAHTSAWRSRLRSTSPLIYRSTTWRLPCGLIALSPQSGRLNRACNVTDAVGTGSEAFNLLMQRLLCYARIRTRRLCHVPVVASVIGSATRDPWRTTEESLDDSSDCQHDEEHLARHDPGHREGREEHVRVLGKD